MAFGRYSSRDLSAQSSLDGDNKDSGKKRTFEDRYDDDLDSFDDEEDVEMVGLIGSRSSTTAASAGHDIYYVNRRSIDLCSKLSSRLVRFSVCSVMFLLLIVAVTVFFRRSGSDSSLPAPAGSNLGSNRQKLFQCPLDPPLHDWNDEDMPDNLEAYIGNDTQPFQTVGIETTNMTYEQGKNAIAADERIDLDMGYFLKHYRNHEFDGWEGSFNVEKSWLTPLYLQHIVPRIQSGFDIYESACGIGLKLYMTLEFVKEQTNVTDVTVYGNEYIDSNAKRADKILDVLLSQDEEVNRSFRKGSICTGDSSDLSFVPNESFDMVFTGYLSPLFDPLHLYADPDVKQKSRRKEICNSSEDDWKLQLVLRLEQEKQERWHSQWLSEMLRIAKPGAYVYLHQISKPICDARHDWGGVDTEFWTERGAKQFGWDVDSVEIMEYRGTRYHVILHKREADA